jgi:hypothetical protein
MTKHKLTTQNHNQSEVPSWWVRVGWLIAIWITSVLTLSIIAFGIRKFMAAAGMSVN